MRGQDGKRNSKANLWFVLKCRSSRSGRNPASISFNRSGSEPQPLPLNPSSPLLNVYIYITSTFTSARLVRESPGAIFVVFSTHAHSFAENRAFQTARAFHPVVVGFYTKPELLSLLVCRLRMRSLSRSPLSCLGHGHGPWRPMLTGSERVNLGEVKSV